MNTKNLNSSSLGRTGVIILGGGMRYFTNAWVSVSLFRHLGFDLPIQLWLQRHEYDPRMEKWLGRIDVEVRILDSIIAPSTKLRRGTRIEWVLKIEAILKSDFRNVLFIDADNTVIADPTKLFFNEQFREHGALFWPDCGVTEREHAIWDVMGVPFRHEPEFETGQLVVDKERCAEPLQLALWMNRRADFFYEHIWGDKDTFRFAWHKYGCRFGMTPHPMQILQVPGSPSNLGVMCHQDFDGNRIFQHRNLVKWDLLQENPRIPGFLYEEECRRFVTELRVIWNGRVNWCPPASRNHSEFAWKERSKIVEELTTGAWLLEDRRPKPEVCCGPNVPWSPQRIPRPWAPTPSSAQPSGARIPEPAIPDASAKVEEHHEPPVHWHQDLRCTELGFERDGALSVGARPELSWWDLEKAGRQWTLQVSSEQGNAFTLRADVASDAWDGEWVTEANMGLRVRLFRPASQYPSLSEIPEAKLGTKRDIPAKARRSGNAKTLHIANHALGIGDAVTGFYACAGAADMGFRTIYHTRHPNWLKRASHAGLEVTGQPPGDHVADLDSDYPEQLRYGLDKARWQSQFIAGSLEDQLTAPPFPPVRPTSVDTTIHTQRLDFPSYVLLAPFAAWSSRDWPPHHWRRLAWLLNQAGYECVAVGTKREQQRIESTFSKSNAYWAIGHSPLWIQDAMLGAAAVVGPDSGMVNVAGLLGVPTICIHSHLPPEFLFSCAPSVRSLSPTTKCVFCRWQGDRGFNEGCAVACSALATVGPEEVMTEVVSASPIGS